MIDRGIALTVMSDISANIFAMSVLIMVVTVAGLQHRQPPAPPPMAIEAERDLVLVERAPLLPAQMVAMLFDRASPEGGQAALVDLLADRIAVVPPGGDRAQPLVLGGSREAIAAGLDRFVAGLPGAAPLEVYVVSGDLHPAFASAVQARGVDWTELSVPDALQQGDAWSPGFQALIGRATGLDQFRADLARLLEAAERRRPAGGALRGAAVSPQGGGAPAEPADLAQRLKTWATAALNWIGLLGGLLFVALVPAFARSPGTLPPRGRAGRG